MMAIPKMLRAVTFEQWIKRYCKCNTHSTDVHERFLSLLAALMVLLPRKMMSNTQTTIYQNEHKDIRYLIKYLKLYECQ